MPKPRILRPPLAVALLLSIAGCSGGSGSGAGAALPDPDRSILRLSRDEPAMLRPPHESLEVRFLDDGVGYALWEQQIERAPRVRYARSVPGVPGYETAEVLTVGRLLAIGSGSDRLQVAYVTEDPGTGRFVVSTVVLTSSARGASRVVTTLDEYPAAGALARDDDGRWALAIGRTGVGAAARVFQQAVGGDWQAVAEVGSLLDPVAASPGDGTDRAAVQLISQGTGFALAVVTEQEPRSLAVATWIDPSRVESIEPFPGGELTGLLGLASDGDSVMVVAHVEGAVVSRRREFGSWAPLESLGAAGLRSARAVLLANAGPAGGGESEYALVMAIEAGPVGMETTQVRLQTRGRTMLGWTFGQQLALTPDQVSDIVLTATASGYAIAWNQAGVLQVAILQGQQVAVHPIPDAVGAPRLVAAPAGTSSYDFAVATSLESGAPGALRSVAIARGLGAALETPILAPRTSAVESKTLDGLVAHPGGIAAWSHGSAPRNLLQIDTLAETGFGATHPLATLGEGEAEPAAARDVVCIAVGPTSMQVVWDEQSTRLPLVGADWSLRGGWRPTAEVVVEGSLEEFWGLGAVRGGAGGERLWLGRGARFWSPALGAGQEWDLGNPGTTPARSEPRFAARDGRVVMALQDFRTPTAADGYFRAYDDLTLDYVKRLPGYVADTPLAVELGTDRAFVLFVQGGRPVMMVVDAVGSSRTLAVDEPIDSRFVGAAVTDLAASGWARVATFDVQARVEFEDGGRFEIAVGATPRGAPTILDVDGGVVAAWWEGEEFVSWTNVGGTPSSAVVVGATSSARRLQLRHDVGGVELFWIEDLPREGGSRIVRRRFLGKAWGPAEELLVRSRRISTFDVCQVGTDDLGLAWIDGGAVWSQVLERN